MSVSIQRGRPVEDEGDLLGFVFHRGRDEDDLLVIRRTASTRGAPHAEQRHVRQDLEGRIRQLEQDKANLNAELERRNNGQTTKDASASVG